MDTLTINEKLKQAGVAEQQAQAVTGAIQEGIREAEEYADDAVEEGKKELAKQADIVSLKADIAKLDAKLESGMTAMELRLEKNLAERDARTMRFTAGLIVAMTGVFAAIVKFL